MSILEIKRIQVVLRIRAYSVWFGITKKTEEDADEHKCFVTLGEYANIFALAGVNKCLKTNT